MEKETIGEIDIIRYDTIDDFLEGVEENKGDFVELFPNRFISRPKHKGNTYTSLYNVASGDLILTLSLPHDDVSFEGALPGNVRVPAYDNSKIYITIDDYKDFFDSLKNPIRSMKSMLQLSHYEANGVTRLILYAPDMIFTTTSDRSFTDLIVDSGYGSDILKLESRRIPQSRDITEIYNHIKALVALDSQR